MGTSPRVVRLISRRVGSISPRDGAKTSLKATSLKKKKSRKKNALIYSAIALFSRTSQGPLKTNFAVAAVSAVVKPSVTTVFSGAAN